VQPARLLEQAIWRPPGPRSQAVPVGLLLRTGTQSSNPGRQVCVDAEYPAHFLDACSRPAGLREDGAVTSKWVVYEKATS
jgi:hypothetical protein